MSLLNPHPWWRDIEPGATVTYKSTHNGEQKGRVILCFPEHVVLNIGRGMPKVVDEANYVRHRQPRKNKPTPNHAK